MPVNRPLWALLDGHRPVAVDLAMMATEMEKEVESRFRAVTLKDGNETNGVAEGLLVGAIQDAVVVAPGTAYDESDRSRLELEDPVTLTVVVGDVGSYVTIEKDSAALTAYEALTEGHPVTGIAANRRTLVKPLVSIQAAPSSSQIKLCKITAHAAGGSPTLSLSVPDRTELILGTISGEIIATPFIVVALDGSGDYSTIQAAIDAAPVAGALIFLKAGTYDLTETLTIDKSNIHITGSGSSSLIRADAGTYPRDPITGQPITGAENSGVDPIIQIGVTTQTLIENVRISNVAIDWIALPEGSDEALNARAIRVGTPNNTDPDLGQGLPGVFQAQNIDIESIRFRSVGFQRTNQYTGVYQEAHTQVRYEDCYFRDLGVGIRGDNNKVEGTVDGCFFVGEAFVCIYLAGGGTTQFFGGDNVQTRRWAIFGNAFRRFSGGVPGDAILGWNGHSIVANMVEGFDSGINAGGVYVGGPGIRKSYLAVGTMIFGNSSINNSTYGVTVIGGIQQGVIANGVRGNGIQGVGDLTGDKNIISNNTPTP